MQAVFEELLCETCVLRDAVHVYWYDRWYSYCDTGRWRRCSARIVRLARAGPSWGMAYSMHVHNAPNFSHYVQHYQAQ